MDVKFNPIHQFGVSLVDPATKLTSHIETVSASFDTPNPLLSTLASRAIWDDDKNRPTEFGSVVIKNIGMNANNFYESFLCKSKGYTYLRYGVFIVQGRLSVKFLDREADSFKPVPLPSNTRVDAKKSSEIEIQFLTSVPNTSSTSRVEVRYGVHYRSSEILVGKSVYDAYEWLGNIFKIPPNAMAYVNGKPRKAIYILSPGDNVEFKNRRPFSQ